MARTPRNYSSDVQLSTTATDVISTVPLSTSVIVRKLSFYNSGSSTREVTVFLLPSSGTAGTSTTLVVKSIPSGKTWNVTEVQGEILEEGMRVQASQDAGSDINANCSGADIT